MRAVVTHADPAPSSGVEPRQPIGYILPRSAIETRELPALAPSDLRIEVERVGICGSDLGVMQTDQQTGRILSSVPLSIPATGRIMGHEGIGIVREIGNEVTRYRPGDWVTWESLVNCHQCAACRRGDFNQCLSASLLGFQRDGVFSELCDIPAQLAHSIGEMAQTEQGRRAATCIEPAACALVGLQSVALQPGKNVLVFGAGPIGLFAAMLCQRIYCAASVQIVEPVGFRRQFAEQWADSIWAVEEFLDAPNSASFDLVIEASGALDNIDPIIRRMGSNSSVLLLSRGTGSLHLRAVDHIVTNGIAIRGSRGHLGGAFDTVLSLWMTGRVPLQDTVTGVMQGLGAVQQALEQPTQVVEEHCKLQVRL